jgi:hypothetical protein
MDIEALLQTPYNSSLLHKPKPQLRKVALQLARAVTLLILLSSASSQNAHPVGPTLRPGTLIPGRSMITARSDHTATFTADVQVMLAGGTDQHGVILASTEIYNPNTEQFTPAGKMLFPRTGHIAAKMGDTKILIAGGRTRGGAVLASSEDYDFETGKFTRQGDMHVRRVHATATVLIDGRLLVTGGEDGTQPLDSAETYDLLNGKWTLVGKMTTPRVHHTATMLMDGKILLVGGLGKHRTALASAEIFDPQTNRFTAAGDLHEARFGHTATRLSTGKILIAGGARGTGKSDALKSAEIFQLTPAQAVPGQPMSGDSIGTGNLTVARAQLPNSYTLRDGRAVVVGGASNAEVYESRVGDFREIPGSMGDDCYAPVSIQLMDGSIRIFGGTNAKGISTAKSWIYRP